MRAAWLLLWGLLPATSQAAGPEVWSALYNGRLIESADRDQSAAMAVYEAVLEHLPEDDPMRAELLYWLGRARFDAGDLPGARQALAEAATAAAATSGRDERVRFQARAMLGMMMLAERRITALPYNEGFETGSGAFVRGWQRGDPDSLSTTALPDHPGRVLSWQVDVRAGEDDFIRLALAEDLSGVSRVRLQLRAGMFDAHVRILLEDEEGQRWTAPVQQVPTGRWIGLDLGLQDFAPADAPASLRRPDPRQVRHVEVRDVTAYHSTARGENHILLDNLELL